MAESRMHISMAGFAIFLAINTSQAWGGVFPFLPTSFQTDAVTLIFYLTQALSLFTTFVLSALGAYLFPGAARRMMVGIVTTLVFLGSASIIAAMYAPALTMAFVVSGGFLLGVGCAGMFMLWQRYFASIHPHEGNLRLVVGIGFASLLYFALHLIPNALTAFLVPVVLLPLGSLALTLSMREMTFDQPMFEDIPKEHPQVYRHAAGYVGRAAIGVGAIAFTSGLARGVALLNPDVNAIINVSSMLGSLLAASLLLLAWRTFTIRFDLDAVFLVVFPLLGTGLLLFPFMRSSISLNLFAGVAYMAFALVVAVMMMQSAQLSRDRGVSPVFSYGLLGSVAYGAQSVGFLLGWLLYDSMIPGVSSVEFLSLAALYVLSMTLFASNRLLKKREDADVVGQVELIHLQPAHATHPTASDLKATGAWSAAEPPIKNAQIKASATSSGASRKRREKKAGREYIDRLSKQCQILRQEYGLTNRETEVMENIARGLSMANIATELFISENTVHTHAKHIYAKLDIHSRQELGALLQNVQLEKNEPSLR